jgi:hypothetical protein
MVFWYTYVEVDRVYNPDLDRKDQLTSIFFINSSIKILEYIA